MQLLQCIWVSIDLSRPTFFSSFSLIFNYIYQPFFLSYLSSVDKDGSDCKEEILTSADGILKKSMDNNLMAEFQLKVRITNRCLL